MSDVYLLPDEPRPSRWNRFAVSPNGPLLAAMLCGAWLAWPWFAFNAIAMGSPTRKKEIAWAAVGAAGTLALAATIAALLAGGYLESRTAIRFALLGVAIWKLSLCYYVNLVQRRTFEVYRYYGGIVRNATYVLAIGYYARSVLIGMTDDPFWIIILLGGV
ncbi:MAG TPA: hypothetical protein VLX92_04395 [Kofleriaceae bacterium]|nr:hypothetical protein [Kofleriaceae bacterium]